MRNMKRRVTLNTVEPSEEIGRCRICSDKLATKVFHIENLYELCFCDECFEKVRRMFMDFDSTPCVESKNMV